MPPPQRRARRRILPALAATAASALALSGPAAPAHADPSTSDNGIMATPENAPAAVSVTLLTGDVVKVRALGDGTSTYEIERAEGSTGGVRTSTYDGDTYVVPEEAEPYLAAGTVDADLFNVTDLIAYGYTDGIPVIAAYGGGMPRTLAAPAGAGDVRALPSIGAAAYTVDGSKPGSVWDALTRSGDARSLSAGVTHLWLDGKVQADLTQSVPQIGAPQAWSAGYDGTGVTAAVLDTGVDATHPDLASRVKAVKDFTGSANGAKDMHGHGTHVASTIAGTGEGDGQHRGVAPGADLIIGKVLGDDGYGQDSWIIAAMEWAVAQDADVVNMSLGNNIPDDGTDPMALAVDRLSDTSDTLFVIAAGNSGCVSCVSSPASARSALTVSAVDKADRIASFTSQGPLTGGYALKPDLAAPGVGISAARSSYIPGTGLYQSMNGTSMATPHIVGAAAIVKQEHPDWTGEQLKAALMSSSKQLTSYTNYQIGTGRVDVAAAVAGTLTATGVVDFGFYDWPHGDAPANRTVTYTNSGTADAVVDVSASVANAPAGAFTLSASSVTVPAGGTASVDVTVTPDLLPYGKNYSGQILASVAGTPVAHTAVGLVKEAERYELKVSVIGRDGEPAAGSIVLMAATDKTPAVVPVDGETALRLAPTTYALQMFLKIPGDDGGVEGGLAILLAPEIKLTGDTSVVLDARTAVRSEAYAPESTETRQRHVWVHRKLSDVSKLDTGVILPITVEDVYVTPTAPVTTGEFEYYSRWREGEAQLSVSLLGIGEINPSVQPGSVQEDFRRLARRTVYAGNGTAAEYAGLPAKGAIAVITRDDAVSPAERSAAAKTAGAALLLVVNDRPGLLMQGGYDSLLVGGVKQDEGRALVRLAKYGMPLTAVSVKDTPYVYDLVDPHPGYVPGNLTYRPQRGELARVDAVYHGKDATPGGSFRWDGRPWAPNMIGFAERMTVPAERTEWVSAPAGSRFHEIAYTGGTDWESRGGVYTYAPGSRQTTEWFAPVVRPRLGLGAWQPKRNPGGWTQINITPWTDSGYDHAGFMDSEKLNLCLYQGDTLLKQSPYQSINLTLPTERKDYRLVMDAERDAAWEYSTRTHTEWTFGSAAPTGTTAELIALLQLDYQVATDLGGDVKAGSKVTVGLSASHMPGVTGGGNVTGASFAYSYDDGATWHDAVLKADGKGGWTVELTTPKDASAYVSVRATAHDDAGNGVGQEVIRAFGLR